MENSILYYVLPLLKNMSVISLTVWLLILGAAIKKVGLDGFSFKHWLWDNSQRFLVGFVFILSLSTLMALTDVAPLFKFFGFDINASPVGLGISIAALLMISVRPGKKGAANTEEALTEIQQDAQNIIVTSAEVKDQ